MVVAWTCLAATLAARATGWDLGDVAVPPAAGLRGTVASRRGEPRPDGVRYRLAPGTWRFEIVEGGRRARSEIEAAAGRSVRLALGWE